MESDRPPTCVFRCDASPKIGGGHVVRCMALAAAMAEAGWRIGFAVSDETPATVRELEARFGELVPGFAADGGDAVRLRAVWSGGVDLLVVDHYGLGEPFERQTLGWARRRMAIDDFPTRRHECDVLVDTTHGRKPDEYRHVAPAGALILCGSRYAMLRAPFRKAREALAPLASASRPPRLLVTFGMTDSVNATGLALAGLAVAGVDLEVVAVLGSRAPWIGSVKAAVGVQPGWRLVADADADAMAELTKWADVVVGAPGSASYERCCLGKPSLLLQLVGNQAGNAASLTAAGAAELVGVWPDVDAQAVASSLTRLLREPGRLAAMSRAAWAVTDGQGVARIASAARGLLR